MNNHDFVDVEQLLPEAIIDVVYATSDNFMKELLYPTARVFLRRGTAKKLIAASHFFKQNGFQLKIFDGYRPFHITEKMWEKCRDDRYVAPPWLGSKHNRGAAIDATLVQDGVDLLMPTPFDFFGEAAHSTYMDLPQEILQNRNFFHQAMESFGFTPLPTEWWHFDDIDWKMYAIEDYSFDELAHRMLSQCSK